MQESRDATEGPARWERVVKKELKRNRTAW